METKSKDQKMSIQQDKIHELRANQLAGEREMIAANVNSKYQIDKQSAGYVHILTRIKHIEPGSKSFRNEDRIVKVHAKEFDRRAKEGAFKTYDELEIIHDPRDLRPSSQDEYIKLMKPDHVNVLGDVAKNVEAAKGSQAKHEGKLREKEAALNKSAEELEVKRVAMEQQDADIKKRLEDLDKMEKENAAKAEDLAKQKAALEGGKK